jgi:hypothetical protein
MACMIGISSMTKFRPRRPSLFSAKFGAAAVAIVLSWGCGGNTQDANPVVVEALGGLPYESISDVSTFGDFGATFAVLSERDFSDSDISARADGLPNTVPPAPADDTYVGRVVRVGIVAVYWDSGRVVIPQEFEFVDFGSNVSGSERRPVVLDGAVRLEVGETYFGTFSNTGAGLAPLNPRGIYTINKGALVAARSSEGRAVGPPELRGVQLGALNAVISSAPIHESVRPFLAADAYTRLMLSQQASSPTPVASSLPPDSTAP